MIEIIVLNNWKLLECRWTIELDPRMVGIIEGTWSPPGHVLVAYNSCNPNALSFFLQCSRWPSGYLQGLRRPWEFSLFYLAPMIEFNVVVGSGVRSCCHFFATVGLYSARVCWFHLPLACGLSVTPFCFFRGLSLLCKAEASLLLVVLLRCRRVWRFVWAVWS